MRFPVAVFVMLLAVDAWAGIPDGAHIYISSAGTGRVTIAPCGGEELDTAGPGGQSLAIYLTVLDTVGDPVESIPPTDIWLWHPSIWLCGPAEEYNHPDGQTNSLGETSFTGSLFGSVLASSEPPPCDLLEMHAVVLGVQSIESVEIGVDSPDLNGDGQVTIGDMGILAGELNCTECNLCCDYNESGAVTTADFGIFAQYYNQCSCQ